MKARLRKAGVGGAIAALLATGALLLPAAPAQAQVRRDDCPALKGLWEFHIEYGNFWYGMILWEQWSVEC